MQAEVLESLNLAIAVFLRGEEQIGAAARSAQGDDRGDGGASGRSLLPAELRSGENFLADMLT